MLLSYQVIKRTLALHPNHIIGNYQDSKWFVLRLVAD